MSAMKSIDEIERLLGQTPVPCIVEGAHRKQLKERLLMEPLPVLQEENKTRNSLFAKMSPTLKVAAAILAVVVLVGAGWAAEKIYEKLKFTEATLILENNPPQEWKLSNGNTMTTSGMIGTDVNPEDPQAIETAQRHHEEMKELIAEKKYTFLKTIDNKIDGSTQYVYNFTFSDGKQSAVNFAMPLDEVASWDDYQRKIQETRNRYQEQVNKAIAAGKYRLINQDVIFMHICVDRASQEMIRVQRIPLSDGKEIALYRSYDLVDQEQGTTQPQSSWQEHLQAIRAGDLELVNAETMFNYTYEVLCDDGTKRIFRYGGGDPLKEPKTD
jgi:hypothetical protein